jgi:hypothetical protein
MNAMPNSERVSIRVFEQLDRAIAEERRPAERAILTAKRACALARFAMIAGAKSQIAKLREDNIGFEPRLSAWIMFCEGLIHHFENLDATSAIERLKRSRAIAVAVADAELDAANLAWIANCHFVLGNSGAALEQLANLFSPSKELEPDTLARAYLVLADLISWSGQPAHAMEWYKHARLKAVEYGDLALQSLIMFNSVSFHVADLTLKDCMLQELSETQVKRISLEVSSIVNLDKSIGQSNLSYLVPLLSADMFILEKKFSDALLILNSVIDHMDSISPKRLTPKIVAQRAWANAKLSNIPKALDDCALAEQLLDCCSDVDDLAVLHSRLAKTYKICSDPEKADRNEASFLRCFAALERMQSGLRASIDETLNIVRQHTIKNPA